MKKFLSLLLVLATVCGMLSFSGCRDVEIPSETEEERTFEIPILPQGTIPEMPDYIAGENPASAVLYGEYCLFWGADGLRFQLYSNPTPTAYPGFFDALAQGEDNPFYHFSSPSSFLVDPISSAENGGIPTLIFSTKRKVNLGEPILYQICSFNIATQKPTVLKDGIADKIQYLWMYKDRIYFATYGADQGTGLFSMKNDGSDFCEGVNAEKEMILPLHCANDRIYYTVYDGNLYSADLNWADHRVEAPVESDIRILVHGDYLYYSESQGRKEFGGVEHTCYNYYRISLKDPQKKELILEDVYGAGGPQGTLIPFRRVEDLRLLDQKKKCLMGLYLFDAATGEVKTVFRETEEVFSSKIMAFQSGSPYAVWKDSTNKRFYYSDFGENQKTPAAILPALA